MGLAHGANIVNDGLVFYADPMNPRSWTGPTSNTVNSLKGNNTGSIFNDTSGSFGANTSFDFDGTDDHISTNFIPSDSITTSVTLAGWANFNSLANNALGVIIGIKGDPTSKNLALSVAKYGHEFLFYFGMGSQAGYGPSIDDVFSTNKWVYLAMTYPTSATGTKYYFNGVLHATDSFSNVLSGNVPSNPGISIGARYQVTTGAEQFNINGQIGPVQIYNRELSEAELTQNYNALKGRFGL